MLGDEVAARREARMLLEQVGSTLSAEARRVRHLGSYVARHGRHMLCIYEAPDAEAARLAQSKRNMPFESAWQAKLYP
jgi:hypothetical protein